MSSLSDHSFRQPPALTVVIPTHNRAQLLSRAINSVLQQSFSDFELLVVDDMSTDNTPDVVRKFRDPRIRYIRRNMKGGAAAARNTGIRSARGAYISFLDDDDEYLPGFLEEMNAAFSRSSGETAFGWCGIRWTRDTEEGELFLREYVWNPAFASREEAFLSIMKHREVGTNAGLTIRRDAVGKIGLFDESLPKAEDTDFLIRISRLSDFVVVPKALVKVHVHDGPRLTAYDSGMARAYERIVEKHQAILSAHTELWVAGYYKLGWLHYHSGNRLRGRECCLRVLRRNPVHAKTWAVMVMFETLGTRAAGLHRWLSGGGLAARAPRWPWRKGLSVRRLA